MDVFPPPPVLGLVVCLFVWVFFLDSGKFMFSKIFFPPPSDVIVASTLPGFPVCCVSSRSASLFLASQEYYKFSFLSVEF